MIKIEEKRTVKLPGKTSLFLKVEFNRDNIPMTKIVQFLKLCETYQYNPKTYIWELPVVKLSFLLDNLTFYDDIELTLLKENQEIKPRNYPQVTYKTKPFKHQEEAIEYGLNDAMWLLTDAPGLGKSASIIYLAEELRHQRNLKHCLIICGINTLKTNWKDEIAKHSNLSSVILGQKLSSKGNIFYESVEKRAEQLRKPIEEFFIITNIETFRSDSVLEAFKNSSNKIDMVVVDEIHKCKNSQSQQGKNLLKIDNVQYKVGLTGTLLLNNPLDAYVPLKWIERERCTLTMFKNFYCEFGGMTGDQLIGLKNLDVLKDQLASCSLRRTKDLLKLPPKTIINEMIDMNDAHKKFYEDITKGIKSEVDRINLKDSVLGLITRLRQATACPSILTSSNIVSSKVERAIDLTEQIISNGDKVVIFSTFKETVYNLEESLKEYKPLIMTGDMSDQQIFERKEKFQNDADSKIIIATWQKMGTGITLTAANYMIWIDQPWTAGIYEQGCDRIHRIGTERSVFIYNLICKDTIDETVIRILERKEAIEGYVVDDIVTDKAMEILSQYIQDM